MLTPSYSYSSTTAPARTTNSTLTSSTIIQNGTTTTTTYTPPATTFQIPSQTVGTTSVVAGPASSTYIQTVPSGNYGAYTSSYGSIHNGISGGTYSGLPIGTTSTTNAVALNGVSTYQTLQPSTLSSLLINPPPATNENPFPYRDPIFGSMSRPRYSLENPMLDTYTQGIFAYHDRDRTGSMNMMQFIPMMTQLCNYMKMPPPKTQDLYHAMNQFDTRGDGALREGDFKRMVGFLAGR